MDGALNYILVVPAAPFAFSAMPHDPGFYNIYYDNK